MMWRGGLGEFFLLDVDVVFFWKNSSESDEVLRFWKRISMFWRDMW